MVHRIGCDRGCDEIDAGDLILRVDDVPIRTIEQYDAIALTDGQPHVIEYLTFGDPKPQTVEIVARPNHSMPPLPSVPPFWTIESGLLGTVPDWARCRMFGHASPEVALVDIDGGSFDGRQLYGSKHLIVYWDRDDEPELAAAITFLQELQRAQAELTAAEVDIVFAQLRFRGGSQEPMTSAELRAFQKRHTVTQDGRRLPPVPMARVPTDDQGGVALGMEPGFTVIDNLVTSPAVVLIDARGVVRWHSEGTSWPTFSRLSIDPARHVILEAIRFALEEL